MAIDLFCGLGGWTDGLLAEGWDVIGFDIERHQYGDAKYPAKLVLQDVLTLHGKQFKDADLIVASPPCQEFSYMAMPWTLAKAKRERILADPEARKRLTALFDACFRIQREACEAAGRHIPLLVENVRGAQPWVGRSRWNYGSFHLWGDVPALMPITRMVQKFNPDGTGHPLGSWFAIADSKNRGSGSWFNIAHNTTSGCGNNPDGRKLHGFRFDGSGRSFQSASVEQTAMQERGVKGFTPNGEPLGKNTLGRKHGSKSKARKEASATIAKIPLPLSRYIASVFKPSERAVA